jgi:hypothetical protein
MVEDELDHQLTSVNEEWIHHVYDEDSYFYRIRTNPTIPALENKIGGFYYKEVEGGIILQLLTETESSNNLPDTELVFVSNESFEISRIERAGAYFLYNDINDNRLIRGFNKKEEIEFLIQP